MDINTIVNIVSNVGFPIACVAALFYLLLKEQKERHEESRDWMKCIDNNTKAIEILTELFKNGENNNED